LSYKIWNTFGKFRGNFGMELGVSVCCNIVKKFKKSQILLPHYMALS